MSNDESWLDASAEHVKRTLTALLDEVATDDAARLEALAKRPPSVEVPRRNALPATNGGVRCDTAHGPCACGAWHEVNGRQGAL